MRWAKLIIGVLGVAAALAQTNRGTITGSISDSTGAMVANAAIQAKNGYATAQMYPGASTTQTGKFTIGNLPPGDYQLTVEVQSFKKYLRKGLEVLRPLQIIRVDIALEVGSERGNGHRSPPRPRC